MKPIYFIIKGIVWTVLTLIWTIVGFLLWIPFLIKMMGNYMRAIIASMFTSSDLETPKRNLEQAINSYKEGFLKINYIWKENSRADYSFPILFIDKETIIINIIFSLVFWLGISVLVLNWYS